MGAGQTLLGVYRKDTNDQNKRTPQPLLSFPLIPQTFPALPRMPSRPLLTMLDRLKVGCGGRWVFIDHSPA